MDKKPAAESAGHDCKLKITPQHYPSHLSKKGKFSAYYTRIAFVVFDCQFLITRYVGVKKARYKIHCNGLFVFSFGTTENRSH